MPPLLFFVGEARSATSIPQVLRGMGIYGNQRCNVTLLVFTHTSLSFIFTTLRCSRTKRLPSLYIFLNKIQVMQDMSENICKMIKDINGSLRSEVLFALEM